MLILENKARYEYSPPISLNEYLEKEPTVVADIPFKIAHVIESDVDGASLKYLDFELLKLLECPVSQIASKCLWRYPNYHKTQMSILVSKEVDNWEFTLMLEVFPPNYSDEDKQNIFKSVENQPKFLNAKDERERKRSWYAYWQEIFETIDEYTINNVDPEYGFFKITFTPEEEKTFLSFISEQPKVRQLFFV